jgi:hypothetical protein
LTFSKRELVCGQIVVAHEDQLTVFRDHTKIRHIFGNLAFRFYIRRGWLEADQTILTLIIITAIPFANSDRSEAIVIAGGAIARTAWNGSKASSLETL